MTSTSAATAVPPTRGAVSAALTCEVMDAVSPRSRRSLALLLLRARCCPPRHAVIHRSRVPLVPVTGSPEPGVMAMPSPVLLLGVLSAAAGVPAGVAVRLLLRRLRRGARIPPPWCELGVAVAWGTTGAAAGVGLLPVQWVPVLLALGWFAVAAGAVDVRHRRLPDALTLPALPLALLLLVPLGLPALLRGLAGAAGGGGAHAPPRPGRA